jgi:hypothetical protein
LIRSYDDYLRDLEAAARAAGLRLRRYAELSEAGRLYPAVCLESDGRREAVVTTGFHGEEPAGPLTVLARLQDIAQTAKAAEVALRIYPCINPSGFERGTRYNASGEKPNNDLLRYEVSPGIYKGELNVDEPFVRWSVFTGGPKETQALRADLEAHPPPASALDVHQDNYQPGAFTYAYVFGDREPYRQLIRQSERFVVRAAHCQVDEKYKTDEAGLVAYHDGSVTDYFCRRGTLYTAALETTTQSTGCGFAASSRSRSWRVSEKTSVCSRKRAPRF